MSTATVLPFDRTRRFATEVDANFECPEGWSVVKSARGNRWQCDPPQAQGADPAPEMELKPEAVPASPNRVLDAQEFIGELKPRQWRVKKLQPLDAQITFVFGVSGAGKSFFVTDVYSCVHRGTPWNGQRVTQGRVIRLIAEGAEDARYRDVVYARKHAVELSALPRVIDNAPDLFKKEHAIDVINQIRAAGGCDVLIIDTLSATFSGNENSSDMNNYIRNVKQMRRALQCAVVIITHCGKDETRGMRGWSGQRAAADVELEVTRDEDMRTVTCTKMKGSADGAQFSFKLPFVELGRDEDGEPYGSCVVEYLRAEAKRPKLNNSQKQAKAVLAKLCKNGPSVPMDEVETEIIRVKGIKDVKSYHGRDARKTLYELRDLGVIRIDGDACGFSNVIADDGGWLDEQVKS